MKLSFAFMTTLVTLVTPSTSGLRGAADHDADARRLRSNGQSCTRDYSCNSGFCANRCPWSTPNGVCSDKAGVGGRCFFDSFCHAGLICVGAHNSGITCPTAAGTCQIAPTHDLRNGSKCTEHDVCASGYCRPGVFFTGEGMCDDVPCPCWDRDELYDNDEAFCRTAHSYISSEDKHVENLFYNLGDDSLFYAVTDGNDGSFCSSPSTGIIARISAAEGRACQDEVEDACNAL